MILRIRLVPRSGRTGFLDLAANGVYKLGVKAAPVQGKANEELIRWLARQFRADRSKVIITAGKTSRTKSVRIQDPAVTPEWYRG